MLRKEMERGGRGGNYSLHWILRFQSASIALIDSKYNIDKNTLKTHTHKLFKEEMVLSVYREEGVDDIDIVGHGTVRNSWLIFLFFFFFFFCLFFFFFWCLPFWKWFSCFTAAAAPGVWFTNWQGTVYSRRTGGSCVDCKNPNARTSWGISDTGRVSHRCAAACAPSNGACAWTLWGTCRTGTDVDLWHHDDNKSKQVINIMRKWSRGWMRGGCYPNARIYDVLESWAWRNSCRTGRTSRDRRCCRWVEALVCSYRLRLRRCCWISSRGSCGRSAAVRCPGCGGCGGGGGRRRCCRAIRCPRRTTRFSWWPRPRRRRCPMIAAIVCRWSSAVR